MSAQRKKLQLAIIVLILLSLLLMWKPVRLFLDRHLVSANLFVSSLNGQYTWFYNLCHLIAFTNDYNNVKIQNKNLVVNYVQNNLAGLSHNSAEINGLEARILKSDITNTGNYFWINKGANDGLQVGMNVVGEINNALGVIDSVYSHSALVKNLLSPKTKISVVDLRSKSLGVATVNAQGKFYLDYLQLKSDVQINDILVSTADNREYLAGLIIGKVAQADTINQTYYLEPLMNLNDALMVKVLMQPSKN